MLFSKKTTALILAMTMAFNSGAAAVMASEPAYVGSTATADSSSLGQAVVCNCDTLCTEEATDSFCPVCGMLGDISRCVGKASASGTIDSGDLKIIAWGIKPAQLEQHSGVIAQQEDGTYTLALPDVNEQTRLSLDEIVSLLPQEITVRVEAAESPEQLPVFWASEEYAADENGAWPFSGQYAFEATLPGGYALAPQAEPLRLVVLLGDTAYQTPDFFSRLSAEDKALLKAKQEELSLADQLRYIELLKAYQEQSGIAMLAMGDTAETPFLISTRAQLEELAGYVNDGNTKYNAAHYLQTADIDLNNQIFSPIGYGSLNPFKGVYDGGNHTISGLVIKRTTETGAGLFGYVDGTETNKAQIKNLVIKDCNISAAGTAGTIVCSYGANTEPLENCVMDGGKVYSSAKNVGHTNMGGIVAVTYGAVINCHATGNVSGDSKLGGIAGTVVSTGSVSSCYFNGVVVSSIGNGENIGGIAGSVESGGSVADCYSVGSISGDKYVGGVVGSNTGTVESCYSTASISASKENAGSIAGICNADGIIKNCAALSPVVLGTTGTTNRVVGSLTTSGTIAGCYAQDNMVVNGEKIVSGGDLDNVNGKDILCAVDNVPLNPQISVALGADRPAWEFVKDKLPILKNAGGTQSSDLPYHLTISNGNTILIKNAEALRKLAEEVNGGDSKAGFIYELSASIDLSSIENWTPIGNEKNPFAGVFNGKNQKISNLKINNSDGKYVGLFGYVQGNVATKAQVKGVILENVSITAAVTETSSGALGALVGYYDNQTEPIERCAVAGGSISAGEFYAVGGLVGHSI